MSAGANAGIIVAGIGLLAGARSGVASGLLGLSMMCSLAGLPFAARVRIDEALFRELADDPLEGTAELDRLLLKWRLASGTKERRWDERCAGALRLWRIQRAILVTQLGTLTGAIILVAIASPRC